MKKCCVLLLLLFLLPNLYAQRIDYERLERGLDSIMARYGKKGLFSGYLHIMEGDKVIYSKGNGWENKAQGIPFSDSTLFCLGSISKTFTAAGIFLLQQEGKLKVEDPVMKYLPAFKIYPDITIQHLLYHTSGFPYRFWGLRDRVGNVGDTMYAEDLYRHMEETQLEPEFLPNEKYSYSNVGYQVLGDLIERVSGMKLADFIEEKLFEPLDMPRSTVGDRLYVDKPGYANPYIRKRRKNKYRPYTYVDVYPDFFLPSCLSADGQYYSTMTEIVKLRELWTTNTIYSEENLQTIVEPWRLSNDSLSRKMRAGFMMVPMGPLGHSFQMTGGNPGLHCIVFHCPDWDITFAGVNNEIIFKHKFFGWEKSREATGQFILHLWTCLKEEEKEEEQLKDKHQAQTQ